MASTIRRSRLSNRGLAAWPSMPTATARICWPTDRSRPSPNAPPPVRRRRPPSRPRQVSPPTAVLASWMSIARHGLAASAMPPGHRALRRPRRHRRSRRCHHRRRPAGGSRPMMAATSSARGQAIRRRPATLESHRRADRAPAPYSRLLDGNEQYNDIGCSARTAGASASRLLPGRQEYRSRARFDGDISASSSTVSADDDLAPCARLAGAASHVAAALQTTPRGRCAMPSRRSRHRRRPHHLGPGWRAGSALVNLITTHVEA